jgi:hypothetical protein
MRGPLGRATSAWNEVTVKAQRARSNAQLAKTTLFASGFGVMSDQIAEGNLVQ